MWFILDNRAGHPKATGPVCRAQLSLLILGADGVESHNCCGEVRGRGDFDERVAVDDVDQGGDDPAQQIAFFAHDSSLTSRQTSSATRRR